MADSEYLKMLGYGQQAAPTPTALNSGIALLQLRNSMNNQPSPEDVQGQQMQKMADSLGDQQSLGGSFAKGFLSGAGAAKLSKAAQGRQAQEEKMQALADYYQKQIENANEIEQGIKLQQASSQEAMGVLPQIAEASKLSFETRDGSHLTQLIKALPNTSKLIDKMEGAPEGAAFNSFAPVGDGDKTAFHAVYDMPDGSKFMSPNGITQSMINTQVIAPIQNQQAMHDFALRGMKQEQELKLAQIDKTQAETKAVETKATPAAKPMPSKTISEINDMKANMSKAAGVNADLKSFVDLIDAGKLDTGLLSRAGGYVANMAGQSTENSRNLSALTSKLQSARNAILLLNKGVQTEGDAQRAMDEIVSGAAKNDTQLVKQRLMDLQALNERAIELQKNQINDTYAEYGKQAPSLSAYEQQPSSVNAGKGMSSLPQGAVQVGTSGGKPVFKTPDGKMFMGQ